MTVQDFSYTISNPYIWGVLMLLSLRAVFKCLMGEEKDYPHAGAFFVVLLGSLYMLAAALGILDLPMAYM